MYWIGKLFSGKDWCIHSIYELSTPTLSSSQGPRGEQRLGDLLGVVCAIAPSQSASQREENCEAMFSVFLYIYILFLCLAYWRVLFFFFLTSCKLPGWSVRPANKNYNLWWTVGHCAEKQIHLQCISKVKLNQFANWLTIEDW